MVQLQMLYKLSKNAVCTNAVYRASYICVNECVMHDGAHILNYFRGSLSTQKYYITDGVSSSLAAAIALFVCISSMQTSPVTIDSHL